MDAQWLETLDLAEAELLLNSFISEITPFRCWHICQLADYEQGRVIKSLKVDKWRLLLLAALRQILPLEDQVRLERDAVPGSNPWGNSGQGQVQWEKRLLLSVTVKELMAKKLPLIGDDIMVLLYWITRDDALFGHVWLPLNGVVKMIEHYDAKQIFTEQHNSALNQLQLMLKAQSQRKNSKKLLTRIDKLLTDDSEPPLCIEPGEAWADMAIVDLKALNEETFADWCLLLTHCKTATSAQPNAKWSKTAKQLCQSITSASIKSLVLKWLLQINSKSTSQPIDESHQDILRGLIWIISIEGDEAIAKALSALALASFKKLAGIGPWAIKIGNACLYGLSQVSARFAVSQLALLKVRVSYRAALVNIDQALLEAAQRAGMTEQSLAQISVPTYGLTSVGVYRQEFGALVAQLSLSEQGTVDLNWDVGAGKRLKSVPTWVKDNMADELKALKAKRKDISKMLTTQKQRIEGFYRESTIIDWPQWQTHYLNHPLVGYLARRLVWTITDDGQVEHVVFHNGELIQLGGKPVSLTQGNVSLWHPVNSDETQVMTWQQKLDDLTITQPFEQVHRQLNTLTQMEWGDDVFDSNRFAGQTLKQHQFSALIATKGWQYSLQGDWDRPIKAAILDLSVKWGIVVEFWLKGTKEQTTSAGVFDYVLTGKVRFLACDDINTQSLDTMRPLLLKRLPALVLSEVYRDIAMFISVSGVQRSD
jgi:hypothetical protein